MTRRASALVNLRGMADCRPEGLGQVVIVEPARFDIAESLT